MDNPSYREKLETLISDYTSNLKKLPEKYKFFAGFLGIGKGPKDDPLHGEFFSSVEKLALEASDSEDYPAVRDFTEALLFASSGIDDRNPSYLYLTAIQRHALPLLARLSGDDKAAFLARYEKEYPKKRRLPVQNDIIKALK